MTFTCPGCTFDCPGAWSVANPDYCTCCDIALPQGTFCAALKDETKSHLPCAKMMEVEA